MEKNQNRITQQLTMQLYNLATIYFINCDIDSYINNECLYITDYTLDDMSKWGQDEFNSVNLPIAEFYKLLSSALKKMGVEVKHTIGCHYFPVSFDAEINQILDDKGFLEDLSSACDEIGNEVFNHYRQADVKKALENCYF